MEAILCSKKRTDNYLWVINKVHIQIFVKTKLSRQQIIVVVENKFVLFLLSQIWPF